VRLALRLQKKKNLIQRRTILDSATTRSWY